MGLREVMRMGTAVQGGMWGSVRHSIQGTSPLSARPRRGMQSRVRRILPWLRSMHQWAIVTLGHHGSQWCRWVSLLLHLAPALGGGPVGHCTMFHLTEPGSSRECNALQWSMMETCCDVCESACGSPCVPSHISMVPVDLGMKPRAECSPPVRGGAPSAPMVWDQTPHKARVPPLRATCRGAELKRHWSLMGRTCRYRNAQQGTSRPSSRDNAYACRSRRMSQGTRHNS